MKSLLKIHETPLQISIVELIRLDFAPGDLIFSATQNGAVLLKKQNKKTGQWYCPEAHKLKMMGMHKGISDLLFWWPIAVEIDGVVSLMMDSGFIEIKTPEGDLDPDQIEFCRRVKMFGGKYAVARKYETVRDTLVGWGVKCLNKVKL